MVFLVLCTSCHEQTTQPKPPLHTQPPPEQPALLCERQQAIIYGTPGLLQLGELGESTGEDLRAAMGTEVALLSARTTPDPSATLEDTRLLCPDTELAGEVGRSFCSGVRIRPGLVLTAQHCLEQRACEDTLVSAGYDSRTAQFESVRCVEVVWEDAEVDVAVLRTDADPAPDSPALDVVTVERAISATLVSHPLGASTRVDPDAEVRPSAEAGKLWARADAFGGSSGGGLFTEEGWFIGIVTGGLADFDWDDEAMCMNFARSTSQGFERVVPAERVFAKLCESAQLGCEATVRAQPMMEGPASDDACRP